MQLKKVAIYIMEGKVVPVESKTNIHGTNSLFRD